MGFCKRIKHSSPPRSSNRQGTMSIRAPDASRFSLRAAVHAETEAHPLYLTAADVPAQTATPLSSKAGVRGLRFDFSAIQNAKRKNGPPTPSNNSFHAAVAAATASTAATTTATSTVAGGGRVSRSAEALPLTPLMPTQMRNAFEASVVTKQDVMRLTAIAEDLELRLKKVTERATAAEAQLAKTHNVLVAERTNTTTRSKEAAAELRNGRAIEQQLRDELAKTVNALSNNKNTSPNEQFYEAVTSAIASDAAAECSKKEVVELQGTLKEKELRISVMTEELVDLNAKWEAAAKEHSSLTEAAAEARSKLHVAEAGREDVLLELASAQQQLEETSRNADTLRTGNDQQRKQLEDLQLAHDSLQEKLEDAIEVAVAQQAQHEQHAQKVDALKAAAQSDEDETCPVRMHQEYKEMRATIAAQHEEVLRLSADENALQSDIDAAIELRADLYDKAVSFRQEYERMFECGHAALPGITGSTAAGAATAQCVIDGEEPEEMCCGEGASALSTRELAARCPLGGALVLECVDCGASVGAQVVPASAVLLDDFDDEQEQAEDADESAQQQEQQEQQPTESHDAAGDMVNAVIADLTGFLKEVKRLELIGAGQIEVVEDGDQETEESEETPL